MVVTEVKREVGELASARNSDTAPATVSEAG
jgi:hypothetical protein